MAFHFPLVNSNECSAGVMESLYLFQKLHCVKSVQIRSFFWSECGKIRTRKNSVFGHISHSVSSEAIRYSKNLCQQHLKETKLFRFNWI